MHVRGARLEGTGSPREFSRYAHGCGLDVGVCECCGELADLVGEVCRPAGAITARAAARSASASALGLGSEMVSAMRSAWS